MRLRNFWEGLYSSGTYGKTCSFSIRRELLTYKEEREGQKIANCIDFFCIHSLQTNRGWNRGSLWQKLEFFTNSLLQSLKYRTK